MSGMDQPVYGGAGGGRSFVITGTADPGDDRWVRVMVRHLYRVHGWGKRQIARELGVPVEDVIRHIKDRGDR